MSTPEKTKPKKPVVTKAPQRPGRKTRATPGFGEDDTGERITRKLRREVEKPILTNES